MAYGAASQNTYSTTSPSMAACDTTNLRLTFTAPPSGRIVVSQNAWAGTIDSTSIYVWGLMEGATTVAEQWLLYWTGTFQGRRHVQHVISGLTPGSSHTYDWAHKLHAGSNAGSFQTQVAINEATMIVQAVT